MNIAEVRQQFPQYADLSDGELARGLHEKYYADVPIADFLKSINFSQHVDPTEGMTGGEKFLSGAGKAFVDIGRGARQLTGNASQDEIDEAKRQDADLMHTGAGVAGNITGNVAALLPTLAVPGVNTVAGSALLGTAAGAAGPVASDESRLGHAVLGGTFGAGGAALARSSGALLSAVRPFLKSGQEELAAKALERFAANPQAVSKVGAAPRQLVTGSQPTLAEATGDAGIAQLQRSAQSGSPELASALQAREGEQNAARVAALRGIGQDDAALAAAREARSAQAGALYEDAGKQVVKSDATLKALAKRPVFQAATQRAGELAANKGEKLAAGGKLDGRSLHYVKMALDDMLESGPTSGIGSHEAASLRNTRNQLVEWIDAKVPGYEKARLAYEELSRPIGQMKVGEHLREKLQSALQEFGASGKQKAGSYAQAVRDSEQTARKATGFESAKLGKIMTPKQLQTIENVAKDLARKASAENAARGVGSNTAQNLAGQTLLNDILGGFGLPKAISDSAVGRTIARPIGFAYKEPERRVQAALADALLNPRKAARLMSNLEARKALAQTLGRRALRGSADAATVALPIGAANAKE